MKICKVAPRECSVLNSDVLERRKKRKKRKKLFERVNKKIEVYLEEDMWSSFRTCSFGMNCICKLFKE